VVLTYVIKVIPNFLGFPLSRLVFPPDVFRLRCFLALIAPLFISSFSNARADPLVPEQLPRIVFSGKDRNQHGTLRKRFEVSALNEVSGNWLGQQTIFAETEDVTTWEPTVNFDSKGKAWAFWMSREWNFSSRTRFYYSVWENGAWSQIRIARPNDWTENYRLTFAVAPNDSIFLVWARLWHTSFGQINTIYSSRGDGTTWETPSIVDSAFTGQYYAPKIAINHGETWVTWYGAEGYVLEHEPYRVYASRWTGTKWEKRIELSEGLSGNHWFNDVAVDQSGTVHAVWQGWDEYAIFYRKKELGQDWTAPVIINPLNFGVAAAGWAAPRISIDSADNVHIVWVGERIGSGGVLEDWDIFYSRSDGSDWPPPVQVNPDDEETDSYPTVEVLGPQDLLIAWNDGDPTSAVLDGGNAAARWNGERITERVRLDDGSYPWNSSPELAVSVQGEALAVWGTIGPDYSPGAIVNNRYGAGPVSVGLTDFKGEAYNDHFELSWQAVPRMYSIFYLEVRIGSRFTLLTEVPEDGRGAYKWSSEAVGPGLRECRLRAVRTTGQEEIFGPIQIAVGGIPAKLLLRARPPAHSENKVTVSVGLPYSGTVRFDVFDVLGRAVRREVTISLPAGWSEVVLPKIGVEAPASNGVYWVRARTTRETAGLRVLVIH